MIIEQRDINWTTILVNTDHVESVVLNRKGAEDFTATLIFASGRQLSHILVGPPEHVRTWMAAWTAGANEP